MKYLPFFLFLGCVCINCEAKAQLSSQKEAAYFATVKAVANFKINDEENLKEIEQLRNDERFNEKLRKMLSKLDNKKNKNKINQKVYNILRNAGKQICEELD